MRKAGVLLGRAVGWTAAIIGFTILCIAGFLILVGVPLFILDRVGITR